MSEILHNMFVDRSLSHNNAKSFINPLASNISDNNLFEPEVGAR